MSEPETPILFDQLGLNPMLLKALTEMGLEKPTPVQEAMIPAILEGKDIQASAQTGSGKSAAFLLPLLQRMLDNPEPNTATRCLVLSPTRELAIQLDKHCEKLSRFTPINSLTIMGGEAFKEQKAKLRKNPEFVIGTPGRLLEHARNKSLELDELEFLVLDEADRILDMGFQEEVMEIIGFCNPVRQTVMLSATLDHRGLKGISSEIQQSPKRIAIGTHRSAHESIQQEIVLADDPSHKQQLCNWLLANEKFRKALVFTNTREHAEALAVFLIQQGQKVACLHGEMIQDERKRVMQLFREGSVKVLVATDLAARGLDVPDIELVINFAMARSGDEYVHRIGRTGRAGETGKAVSLISAQEWNLMESIQRYLNLELVRRTVEAFPARFSGNVRRKKSDKDKKSGHGKDVDKGKVKAKQRHRHRKNIGKRREPSVYKEPSVNQKEPSAGKGSSAGKEPLAGKEPSANQKAPSAVKAPSPWETLANKKGTLAGNKEPSAGKAPKTRKKSSSETTKNTPAKPANKKKAAEGFAPLTRKGRSK